MPPACAAAHPRPGRPMAQMRISEVLRRLRCSGRAMANRAAPPGAVVLIEMSNHRKDPGDHGHRAPLTPQISRPPARPFRHPASGPAPPPPMRHRARPLKLQGNGVGASIHVSISSGVVRTTGIALGDSANKRVGLGRQKANRSLVVSPSFTFRTDVQPRTHIPAKKRAGDRRQARTNWRLAAVRQCLVF